jgi:hypothetical protein
MKDQIVLVETFEEATELGWIPLGNINKKGSKQGLAEVWYKNNTFVILSDDKDGYCSFVEFIPRHRAFQRLLARYNRIIKPIRNMIKKS